MTSLLRIGSIAVLPTLLVCLAMLEVGLRAAGRLPSNTTEGLFEQHGTAYRLRKNLTKVSRTPSFSATIHVNALGFRDKAAGPRKLGGAPYVAWVGDSITFGNGVDYQDSFVGVFGALAEQRRLEVVNLAVGGYHFSESEEMLYDFLDTAPASPSLVIFVLTAPAMAMFEERYSDVLVKDGYIFRKEGWLVPWVIVTLGNRSSAYCFFRDGLRKIQGRLFPPAPGSATQALEQFSRNGPWGRPEVRARFQARLSKIEERVRRSGSKLAYVYLPSAPDLRGAELLARAAVPAGGYDLHLFRDALRAHAARAGVAFVDLTPELAAESAKGKPLSFLQDPHYNADANRLIGRVLYGALSPMSRPR